MHTKEDKTKIYDFQDLTDHYQRIEEDRRTVGECTTDILKFLKEGRVWNKSNNGGRVDGDFKDRIEFIAELKDVFEEMEINDDKGLFLKCPAHEINLKPLIEYLERNRLSMVVAECQNVAERMLDVLHDQNVYDYRENTKKLHNIKLMFECMHANVNR